MTAAAPIDTLPNLGPMSRAALAAAGITTVAQLRRRGAVAAYVDARQANAKVSLNLLWALEAALTGLTWQVVAREHRTSLLLALEQRTNASAVATPPAARPARSREAATSTSTAACSVTPLAGKLGIRAASRVWLVDPPAGYVALLAPLPDGVVFETKASARVDLVQVFVTRRETLAEHLARWRRTLRPDAAVWVSWPKKAARLPTTVTEDVVRELALPLGFVDIKVCAVDAVWSGLKLVVRKDLR